MQDAHYSWVQMPLGRAMHLLDDQDHDDDDWDLPDDGEWVRETVSQRPLG